MGELQRNMGCRTSKMPTAGAIRATARTDACLDAFGLPYDAPGSPVAPIEIATFDDQPTSSCPAHPRCRLAGRSCICLILIWMYRMSFSRTQITHSPAVVIRPTAWPAWIYTSVVEHR